MTDSEWCEVDVRNELIEKIEAMLKDGSLEADGITSVSQFIESAIKEMLEEADEAEPGS